MKTETYWTSSSVLLRETYIGGFIRNVEPLRIGSGREPSLGAPIDLAVLRIQYGDYSLPYVPGSSLKGVVRSMATTIARTMGMPVCTGLARETCMDKKIEGPKGKQKMEDVIKRLMSEKSEEAMKFFWEKACLMCKIFGSPGYKGKIYFEDAYPIDEQGRVLLTRTGARTGIAINRRTGAAMKHALYTVEYVEPNSRFRFNIYCMSLPNYALGLIGLVLRMMHEGHVKIGGFKTRGFGRVEIENLRIRSRDFLSSPDFVMKSLEEDMDREVDVRDLAKVENGWLVFEKDNSWRVLERLEEVWRNVSPKSRSH